MRKLMIAAFSSGAGKTTVTMALTALFMKRFQVQVFKTGPDYIDPMFHTIVSGRPCVNLDPYFLEGDGDLAPLRRVFSRYAEGAGLSIAEAAMGYTDGIRGQGIRGSALSAARSLGMPVLLIVREDELEMAAEFLKNTEDHMVRGILVDRRPAGSGAVKTDAGTAGEGGPDIEGTDGDWSGREIVPGIPAAGTVPHLPELERESRHLGLVTPEDPELLRRQAAQAAERLSESVDAELILRLSADPDGFYLAVARDEAFSFMYEENLRLLRENGAVPVFFSPLRDHSLPAGVSGLWLPGGYPELMADALSVNISMRADIADAVRSGLPTVAECGGFMYLTESIESAYGGDAQMCGALPGRSFRTPKLQRFGYVGLTALEDTLLLKKGETLRAHEFHYWDSEQPGGAVRAVKANGSAEWTCVHASDTLFAGFPHLYFTEDSPAPRRFAEACRRYRDLHGRPAGDAGDEKGER